MKNILITFLKGMAMGIADLVPGVSGGTIAFITGIYPRFINALSKIDWSLIPLLIKGKFNEIIKQIDGWFLITLVSGILCSVVLFSKIIRWLLENYQPLLFAFFLGLVISCIIHLLFKTYKSNPSINNILFFVFGISFGLTITNAMPIFPFTMLFIVLGGFIAISAMLLPGISGSYLLLIMGIYQPLINAISEFNLVEIAPFIVGVILGLLVLSKFIAFVMTKAYHKVLMFICGIMLSTSGAIWPWQIENKIISPTQFATYNQNNYLILCLLLFIAGIFAFVIFIRFSKDEKK